ncbi:MAG: hypothetical protein LWX83_15680 [Anaerolineae bacterium]|nr:hypothetical protein [Anaerolineae bacterium]
MDSKRLSTRYFDSYLVEKNYLVEAVCVDVGADLVVVVGGGSRYHIGSTSLTISMPSIKDSSKLTNSTYLVPVPGHKEENLARESSLILSRSLKRNVLVSVGIHEDQISKADIGLYIDCFNNLINQIIQAYLVVD